MDYGKILDDKMRFDTGQSITGAIGQATCDIAHDLNCTAILTASATGRTARVVSRYRPRAPIICATNRAETYQRLALVWGVQPVMVDIADDSDSMMQACIDAAEPDRLCQERRHCRADRRRSRRPSRLHKLYQNPPHRPAAAPE